MTPRLTAPQMAVLRALDALPEGEWTTAKDGGFNANSANGLGYRWFPSMTQQTFVHGMGSCCYRLTPAGRALVAQLKAEGKL